MTIQIDRYRLRKKGFQDIFLRKYWTNDENYVWEMMSSPAHGWNEARWSVLNLEQFPEETILKHIDDYGVDYYENLG